jgi:hypothetical protein
VCERVHASLGGQGRGQTAAAAHNGPKWKRESCKIAKRFGVIPARCSGARAHKMPEVRNFLFQHKRGSHSRDGIKNCQPRLRRDVRTAFRARRSMPDALPRIAGCDCTDVGTPEFVAVLTFVPSTSDPPCGLRRISCALQRARTTAGPYWRSSRRMTKWPRATR